MTNTVTVTGNLGQDPELRYTPNGLAVATINVADTPRSLDKETGQWKDGVTDWVRAQVWGQYAENVANTLRKGHQVVVIGKYKLSEYTDKTTGEKKTSRVLEIERIGLDLRNQTAVVSRANNTNQAPANTGARPSAPAADTSFADNTDLPF